VDPNGSQDQALSVGYPWGNVRLTLFEGRIGRNAIVIDKVQGGEKARVYRNPKLTAKPYT
jgi:hypothetical protein